MEKKHDTIDNVHENLRTFMSHRLWDMYKEYDISPITTQQQEPDEILLIMIFCKTVVGIRRGKGGDRGWSVSCWRRQCNHTYKVLF